MEETETAEPSEKVLLLRTDYELLQGAASLAMQHYLTLCATLEIDPPRAAAPAEVFEHIIVPVITKLMSTQRHVAAAETEIRKRAKRFGNQSLTLPGGAQGLKVGERLKDEAFMNREERRRHGR